MNNLIKTMGGQKRWVNWQYKLVAGKQTKMPLGKSNDPATWSTYKDLKDKEHVGLMFGLDKKFLGVDIDHCIENSKIIHEDKEEIENFIKKSNTYTEFSPSKTGIHLYFEISDPLELIANKKAPYECYSSLRFFTVTANPFGKEKEVRTITSAEAIKLLSLIRYPWGKDKKDEAVNIEHSTVSLEDSDLLKKMFSSKNGAKIKALYDGDTTEYGGDDSNADSALCMYLSFWSGKDKAQIERIWLSSPLGARKKTQDRKDYRDRTIVNVISKTKEVYKPVVKTKLKISINEDEDEEVDFNFVYKTTDKKSYPYLCLENITEVLRKHPDFKGLFRFDAFKGYKEINVKGKWRQFLDIDGIVIQSKISRLFSDFQAVSKAMAFDAIDLISEENKMDSAVNYIESLKWDGVSRLDTWLCKTYGVEDNLYHRAVGANWLKGLVKRIMVPGCQFDYVLVLEGPQGAKKSTSLGILGGAWHVETTMSTDTKDFFMQFHGKVIVEFSEGETLSRTEVKRMKAIITTRIDTYRLPYERVTADHPRRCVFAMTTNSSQYLKDETGNRRWWPVETILPKADVLWLEENREQLFAEAYERVINKKEETHEVPEEEARAMQESRRITDPNTELIVDWYYEGIDDNKRNNGITILDVYTGAYGNNMGAKKMNKYDEMSIATVLKDVLKLDKNQVMRNGIRASRWFMAGTVESDIEVESLSGHEFNKLKHF